MLDFFASSSTVRCGNSENNINTLYIIVYVFNLSLRLYGLLKTFNLKPNNCFFRNFLFLYCIEYPK